MLSININQDVEQYQETVAAGMNAKQTIAAILSILAAALVVCIAYFGFGIPLKAAIYIAIPVCVPIMLPALGKQYGLTVMERFKGSNRRKHVVAFATTRSLQITKTTQESDGKNAERKKRVIFRLIGGKKKEQQNNENKKTEQSEEENSEKRQVSQDKK